MYWHIGHALRGNLCPALALQDWISNEVTMKHSVAKEKRKAGHERALARPKREREPF